LTYILRKAVLGRHPTVEVSAEEHAALRTAWDALFSLVQVEESWDCIIQSYLELEQHGLSAALQSSVLGMESYDAAHDLRLGFARRLSNLLHACRAYVDQTPQRLGEVGDPLVVEVFTGLRRQAHAANFAYRLMDGLRNHAQHHGQPAHGATFGSHWTGGPAERSRRLLFSVEATIDVEALRNSPKLNAKLREELSQDLTQVDAPAMVRAYLEGLGSGHEGVRAHLKGQVSAWEATISEAIACYAAVNQGNVLGLELVELAEDGSTASRMPLFAEMPGRLRGLMRRNGSLVNLRKRVVTNGPISTQA
jgi:hypothetical protein